MSLSLVWRPVGGWKDTGLQGKLRDRALGGPHVWGADMVAFLMGYRENCGPTEQKAIDGLIEAIQENGEIEVAAQ